MKEGRGKEGERDQGREGGTVREERGREGEREQGREGGREKGRGSTLQLQTVHLHIYSFTPRGGTNMEKPRNKGGFWNTS